MRISNRLHDPRGEILRLIAESDLRDRLALARERVPMPLSVIAFESFFSFPELWRFAKEYGPLQKEKIPNLEKRIRQLERFSEIHGPLLTCGQFALKYGVTRQCVLYWERVGRITPIKLWGKRFYKYGRREKT